MTAIVYDGKTIASDRAVFNRKYNICGYEKKIIKWSRGVWTSAGDTMDGTLFAEWLESDRSGKPPKLGKEFESIYTEDGKTFIIDNRLTPQKCQIPAGIGIAGNDCEVLCRVGYSARDAIKAVMKWNVGCGGKIDVVNVG